MQARVLSNEEKEKLPLLNLQKAHIQISNDIKVVKNIKLPNDFTSPNDYMRMDASSITSESFLENLPEEVLSNIAGRLQGNSLSSFALVSHKLRHTSLNARSYNTNRNEEIVIKHQNYINQIESLEGKIRVYKQKAKCLAECTERLDLSTPGCIFAMGSACAPGIIGTVAGLVCFSSYCYQISLFSMLTSSASFSAEFLIFCKLPVVLNTEERINQAKASLNETKLNQIKQDSVNYLNETKKSR